MVVEAIRLRLQGQIRSLEMLWVTAIVMLSHGFIVLLFNCNYICDDFYDIGSKVSVLV